MPRHSGVSSVCEAASASWVADDDGGLKVTGDNVPSYATIRSGADVSAQLYLNDELQDQRDRTLKRAYATTPPDPEALKKVDGLDQQIATEKQKLRDMLLKQQ